MVLLVKQEIIGRKAIAGNRNDTFELNAKTILVLIVKQEFILGLLCGGQIYLPHYKCAGVI